MTVERLPESQVVLDIAADPEEFDKALNRATKNVLREIQIPGFRKGHVPRYVVERMIGREVFVARVLEAVGVREAPGDD